MIDERGERLVAAFNATRYRIGLGDPWATIVLDRHPPGPVANWLSAYAQPVAWLITAYNPDARVADDRANVARHRVLADLVAVGGWPAVGARNEDPSGAWPDEPGLLITGLEESRARALARRFGQRALVAVPRGIPATLIWVDRDGG